MSRSDDSIFAPDPARSAVQLPPELVGKSAEEVAAYYQRQLLTRQPVPPAPQPRPKVDPPAPVNDKIDVFGQDPSGDIHRVITQRVAAEVSRTAGIAVPAIVQSCRIACRDAHPDFAKFAKDIDGYMKNLSPEAQMNPEMWDVAYKVVKGEQADTMVQTAVEADRAIRNPVERPTGKGTPPPKPRELTDEERVIAEKFGMDSASFVKAADRYEAEEGRLPLTYDSRKPRQKKAG